MWIGFLLFGQGESGLVGGMGVTRGVWEGVATIWIPICFFWQQIISKMESTLEEKKKLPPRGGIFFPVGVEIHLVGWQNEVAELLSLTVYPSSFISSRNLFSKIFFNL